MPSEADAQLAGMQGGDASALCAAVLPSVRRIIRELRRRRLEDVTQEVVIPERGMERVAYRSERRVQVGVALSQSDRTRLDADAEGVGRFLAQNYDIHGLINDSGMHFASDSATAGGRFLGRMLDALVAEKPRVPRVSDRTVAQLCACFHDQLSGQALELEEVHPVPRVRVPSQGITLKPGVRLRRATSADLRRIHELGGHTFSRSATVRLVEDTHCVLSLRYRVSGTALERDQKAIPSAT